MSAAFDRLHVVARFSILLAAGVWVVYCAHADDVYLKRVGLTLGLAAFGFVALEEGRVRERRSQR